MNGRREEEGRGTEGRRESTSSRQGRSEGPSGRNEGGGSSASSGPSRRSACSRSAREEDQAIREAPGICQGRKKEDEEEEEPDPSPQEEGVHISRTHIGGAPEASVRGDNRAAACPSEEDLHQGPQHRAGGFREETESSRWTSKDAQERDPCSAGVRGQDGPCLQRQEVLAGG